MNKQDISMWCNGECMTWTKDYSNTGHCNNCGHVVISYGEGNPDINFEGNIED